MSTYFRRSAAKLSYQDAQNVLEGKVLGGVAVIPQHSANDIEHDIKVLHGLTGKLRTQRLENGTLSLESLRLQFKLDDEGMPVDCGQYEHTDAHKLIQEVCIFTRVKLRVFSLYS